MSDARLLVTGVDGGLGRMVAERMASRPDVEVVIGVAGTEARTLDGVDVVGLTAEYEGIDDLLERRAIDTIIHADRPWVRPRGGRDAATQYVIATMRLTAAAAGRTATVRRVVMASSTLVYPVSSRAARLHSESEPVRPRRGSLAGVLVEAEGYVRDLASTNPNLSASILRLADLAGPAARDPLSVVLAGPVLPAVWGFDPSVQLLHLDDAAAALGHAADHDLAGIYNVGADDLVRWRQAARLTRKPLLELPAAPARPLAGLLGRMYRLDDADDLFKVLRFGRVAATDAFTRSGFRPARTTARCLQESARSRPRRG